MVVGFSSHLRAFHPNRKTKKGGAMFSIALRQLYRNRLLNGALVLAALAVVLLVVTPSAIKDASVHKPQNYLRANNVDVYVVDPSAFDFASNSILTESDKEKIKSVPGVDDVQSAIFTYTNALRPDPGKDCVTTDRAHQEPDDPQHLSVTLQSFDPTKNYGGPWKLVAGRTVQQDGEIVVDESLENDLGIHLGDQLCVGLAPYTIVGFSGETSAIGKQMTFVTTNDAKAKVFKAPVITHLQVKTSDPDGVTQRIRDLGYHAYSKSNFIKANDLYWDKQISPTLDMVLTVAELSGLFLFMLLALVSVLSRRRMIGVYRALGTSWGNLAGLELVRNLMAASIGLVLGVLLSIPFTASVNAGSPGLDAGVNADLVLASVTTVVGALILALIPSFIYLGRVSPATPIKEVA